MPLYEYRCEECGLYFDRKEMTEMRNALQACPWCAGDAGRIFTPTANIVIAEHFRHNQRDFLPPKGDPAWDKIQMGGDSQIHSRPSAGEQLANALEKAR